MGGLWRQRFAVWSIALAIPFAARALDPSKALTQYTHEAWTGENDLPQTTVQAIFQTRDGYLWLGTQEGLVRFDGVHFTQMDARDVGDIFEGRDGTLWVCTYQGLFGKKDGKNVQYTTQEGLTNNRVNGVCEDTAGDLWIATNLGLNWLSGGRITAFTTKNGLPADEVTTVLHTRGSALWIGTRKGLVHYEGGRFTTLSKKDGLPDESITRLYEDSEGTLWIGTSHGGLCAYRKGRFRVYGLQDGLPDLEIRALCEDRDRNLWIGTQTGGLARLRDGRFEGYSVKEGLSDSAVWSLYEDREGSLWVGTFSGGLNRFKDEKFTTYDSHVGLSNNTVWAVCEGSDGTLWVCTDGGLDAYKDGKFRAYTAKEGLPRNGVSAILEDREGAIWVGTDAGVARLMDDRFTTYGLAQGLPNLPVYSLCEGRDGSLWIGSNGGGLTVLRDGRISVFTKREGLSDEYIRALLEDRDGSLWIGTNGGGLNKMKDGRFTCLTTKEGLPDNFIRSLYQDREGTLWVGTRNGGLCRMRDGKLASFGSKDGLLSDAIFQILEDGRENLWMSCNKGIFKVSKKDLEDYSAGKIPSVPCASFGKADGMKSPECNGGTQPAGWRARDGKLWFPTIKGIVCIDPQRPVVNGVAPPVVMEQVLVDGRPVAAGSSEVRIAAGADRFEFHFTALSLFAPNRVRFKYMLEGHDTGWIDLAGGRERLAVYTNLPPGRFVFRVKACNNDGVWNETGTAFAFRLKPRFHQTWLFYLLVALSLLLLGGALFHFAGVALQNVRVGRTLSRYHSRQVLEKLRNGKGSDVSALASERRRVAILFSDLTGFSDFSDRNEPEMVNRVINEYLTEMTALIEGRSGTIARFMGDGIMAFFGAPGEMDPPEQARCAVSAATAMQKKMADLRESWLQAGLDHDLKLRVGISQDYATVGNFGSKDLMEYTALGSAVNLAARLETACTPGRVLVSFPVYTATKEIYSYSQPEQREFKGFARPVHVAELDPAAGQP